jgi:hypothetical protein
MLGQLIERAPGALLRFQVAEAELGVVSAMLPMKRAAHSALDPDAKRRQQAEDKAEIDAILREVASRARVPMFQHAGLCSHGAMNYPLGLGGAARIVRAQDGSYTLHNQLEVEP